MGQQAGGLSSFNKRVRSEIAALPVGASQIEKGEGRFSTNSRK